MTLNEGQRRFSQSFVDAIKSERKQKYEVASELYLKRHPVCNKRRISKALHFASC